MKQLAILPYNQLTPAEAERLALLAEECGEVVQAISDTLWPSAAVWHQNMASTFQDALEREIGDLDAARTLMIRARDVSETCISTHAAGSAQNIEKWTPSETDSLAFLNKTCGKVIQVVGKTLRHGYGSKHPEGGPTNRRLLEHELGYLDVARTVLIKARNLEEAKIAQHAADKMVRVGKYLHHA